MASWFTSPYPPRSSFACSSAWRSLEFGKDMATPIGLLHLVLVGTLAQALRGRSIV